MTVHGRSVLGLFYFKLGAMESRSEKIIEFLTGKANKIYAEKSILLQLLNIVMLFILVSVVCQVFSGITEFSEMYYLFNAEDSRLGLFFVVLCLVLIEGVKRIAGTLFFAKFWAGSFAYISIIGGLFLISQGFSVYLSIEGSKRIPESLSTPPVMIAAQTIDLDSIHAYHNKEIALQEASITKFFQSNKKRDSKTGNWRLSSSLAPSFAKMKIIRSTLVQEKNIAINKATIKQDELNKEAEAKHVLAVASHEASNRYKGSKFWFWSLGVELAFFLLTAFISWYYYELLQDGNGTDSKKRSKSVNKEYVTNSGTAKRTPKQHVPVIGFKPNSTPKNGTFRACLVCGTDIAHKRKDAKFCSSQCRKNNHENKTP